MPNGARVNMGAYGGTIEASKSVNEWPNPADINHDGLVNMLDVALLAESWLWAAPWIE